MAGASVAYVLLTIGLYSFAGLGDIAVVYANIANLAARIAYCAHFISKKSRAAGGEGLRLSDVLPSKSVIAAAALAAGATHLSSSLLGIGTSGLLSIRNNLLATPHLIHVGIGVFFALIILASWYVHTLLLLSCLS